MSAKLRLLKEMIERMKTELAARHTDNYGRVLNTPQAKTLEWEIQRAEEQLMGLTRQIPGEPVTLPPATGAESLSDMMQRYTDHFGTPYDPKNLNSIPERGIMPESGPRPLSPEQKQALDSQMLRERLRRESGEGSPWE